MAKFGTLFDFESKLLDDVNTREGCGEFAAATAAVAIALCARCDLDVDVDARPIVGGSC